MKNWLRLGCLICLSWLLWGCSKPAEPLRVGLNAWPGYEYLYLADKLGYFEQAGVNVKLVAFGTLGDSRRALERGHIDGMGCTLMEFMLARELPGVNPVIFSVVDFSNGSDMLLARKGITSLEQLRGKAIALEVGTVDVLTASAALRAAGLTFADVRVVNLPQANAVQAFRDGKVDAIQTYPPFAMEAEAENGARRLFDTSQAPGEILDVLVAKGQSLTARTQEWRLLRQAMFRARQYAIDHPSEARTIMAQREGITAQQFAEGLSGITLLDEAAQQHYLLKGEIQPVLSRTHEVLKQLGLVRQPPCLSECWMGLPE